MRRLALVMALAALAAAEEPELRRFGRRDASAGPTVLPADGVVVALSPEGRRAALGDLRGRVRVFECAGGRELRSLEPHKGTVTALALSPAGARLATGSEDNRVTVWDVDNGRQLWESGRHTWHVGSLAFSPDGTALASGGEDGMLYVFDAATGELRSEFKADADGVRSLAFAPDGKTLAVGGEEGRVGLWRASGKRLMRRKLHRDSVKCLSFSQDGRRLASGADDCVVCTMDVERRELLWTTAAVRAGLRIRAVGFAADGTALVALDDEPRVRVHDAENGRVVSEAPIGKGEMPALAAAVSADGRLAACSASGTTLWPLGTSAENAADAVDSLPVVRIAWTADASLVLAATAGGVRAWRVADGVSIHQVPSRGRPTMLAPSPEGKRFALLVSEASGSTHVVLHDLDARAAIAPQDFDHDSTFGFAWSPDGSRFATAGFRARLRVYDARTLAPLTEAPQEVFFPVREDRRIGMAYSPDGRVVYQSDPGGLTAWDGETGAEIEVEAPFRSSLAGVVFSADGRVALLRAGRVWSALELESGREFPATAAWERDEIAVSPDARSVALVEPDGTVRVARLFDGAAVASLEEEVAAFAVAWSPDGRSLAIGFADGSVGVWSPEQKAVPSLAAEGRKAALAGLQAPDPARAWPASESVSDAESLRWLAAEVAEPVALARRKSVEAAVARLADEDVGAREAAAEELRGLGAEAEPAIRACLAKSEDAEVQGSLASVLADFERRPSTCRGLLLRVRAVKVFERALKGGDPEAGRIAREALEKLALHAPWGRARNAARAALDRGK